MEFMEIQGKNYILNVERTIVRSTYSKPRIEVSVKEKKFKSIMKFPLTNSQNLFKALILLDLAIRMYLL